MTQVTAFQTIILEVTPQKIKQAGFRFTGFADHIRTFQHDSKEFTCQLSYDGESELIIEILKNWSNLTTEQIEKDMEILFKISKTDSEDGDSPSDEGDEEDLIIENLGDEDDEDDE